MLQTNKNNKRKAKLQKCKNKKKQLKNIIKYKIK